MAVMISIETTTATRPYVYRAFSRVNVAKLHLIRQDSNLLEFIIPAAIVSKYMITVRLGVSTAKECLYMFLKAPYTFNVKSCLLSMRSLLHNDSAKITKTSTLSPSAAACLASLIFRQCSFFVSNVKAVSLRTLAKIRSASQPVDLYSGRFEMSRQLSGAR